MSDIIDIALIIGLMLLGIVLRQAKISLEASHLEHLIAYITLPILLFTEVLKVKLDTLFLGEVAGISLVYLGLCFIVSYGLTRKFAIKERGTIVFNSTFYNSMFLPFPLIYAFYGDLSVAILFSLPAWFVHNTLGVFLASYWGHGKVEKKVLVHAITFPPLIAFLVGVLINPISAGIALNPVFGWLHSLGLSTLYLSLVFAGLAIPFSKGSLLVFRNRVARLIALNRILISPVLAVILIAIFNPVGIAKNTILIMSLMPPAFTNLIMISRFNLDIGSTCQSIFLPMLISLGIIFSLRFFALI